MKWISRSWFWQSHSYLPSSSYLSLKKYFHPLFKIRIKESRKKINIAYCVCERESVRCNPFKTHIFTLQLQIILLLWNCVVLPHSLTYFHLSDYQLSFFPLSSFFFFWVNQYLVTPKLMEEAMAESRECKIEYWLRIVLSRVNEVSAI